MKYSVTVLGAGNDAFFFLEDPAAPFIIIFNENAPQDLADISVLHTKGNLLAAPEVGDIVIICDKVFTITAVGDEAKTTLSQLGHCTLVFNGASEPDRPGCIMLGGDEPLVPDDIKPGKKIEIY